MEAPRLPQPTQTLAYVVLWRNYGAYRVCAYKTFPEAYRVYDYLIALSHVDHPIDNSFAVYILFLFTGYTYGD